jgi:hypothetical protein
MSVALVVDHGQMEQQIDHGFIGFSPSMNDRSLDDMKLHGAVVRADDTSSTNFNFNFSWV